MGAMAGGGDGARHLGPGRQLDPAGDAASRACWAAWPGPRSPPSCKARFDVSEILTSLMLTYVATLFLSIWSTGPGRTRTAYNFPQSRMFADAATVPIILDGTRLHVGALIALAVAVAVWVLMSRTILGFEIKVLGRPPPPAASPASTARDHLALAAAERRAGRPRRHDRGGGADRPAHAPVYAGLRFHRHHRGFPRPAAPAGHVLGGLLMALSFIGGENAQVEVGLPQAVTGVFQGLLLFFLLAADFLILYRSLRPPRREVAPA